MLGKILNLVSLVALAVRLIGWLRTHRQPPGNAGQPASHPMNIT